MDAAERALIFRKRRLRRKILTHPRIPLRISWALRRFVLTPEQDAVLLVEVREMIDGVLEDAGV